MKYKENDPPALGRKIWDAAKEAGVSRHNEFGKMQLDQAFLQQTASSVLAELMQTCTYLSLITTISEEKEKYRATFEKIQHHVWSKNQMKVLRKEIKKTKRDKIAECKRLKTVLWQVEDDFQELRARCAFETDYVTHACKMDRQRTKKICKLNEKQTEMVLQDLKLELSTESVVHQSMKKIIETKREENMTRLEHWLEKYEVDKEALLNSLDALKESRAKCLDRIAWLNHMTKLYMPIVEDDRRVKKIEWDRKQKLAKETKKATRIQAWWRGTIVRKGMGPFRNLFQRLAEDRANFRAAARKKRKKAKGKGKGKKK